jgi:lantibiotic biosynthesis protein
MGDSILKDFQSDFFVLRTPLLPFMQISHLYSILHKEEDVKPCILDIFSLQHVREAIYLASQDLYSDMLKYEEGKIEKEKAQKIEKSFLKYLVRMSSRCTPFGLFAGCSVGKFSGKTNLRLNGSTGNGRNFRLDMDFLCDLSEKQSAVPSIRILLKFFPNSTIYYLGTELRYIEYRMPEQRRTYHTVTVENSPMMQKILLRAKEGITIGKMKEIIMDDGYDETAALEYIAELIKSQVLVSELEPNVSGPGFFERIAEVSGKSSDSTGTKSHLLQAIKQLINSINDVSDPIQSYNKIKELINDIYGEKKINPNKMFQVDLVKPVAECLLNRSILDQLKEAIAVVLSYNKINPANSKLSQFKRAFYERYEEMTVPVMQVLDGETGLGYLKQKSKIDLRDRLPSEFDWNEQLKLKLSILTSAYKNDLLSVDLSEILPGNVFDKTAEFSLPNSFSAILSILRKSSENYPFNEDHDKTKILFNCISGPSAANLLGRFANGDETLMREVLDLIEKEELLDRDKIYAEIIHLPEARVGNVLTRARLRKYEIPYLANSCANDKDKIMLDDLYLNMKDGRLRLLSRSMGKEVVPRLTTAHGFNNPRSLPFYEFVCDLQFQDYEIGRFWNWEFLSGEVFLPRIVYKDIILAPAKWNISKKSVQDLIDKKKGVNIPALKERVNSVYKMQKMVYLVEADNELLVDLSTDFAIEVIAKVFYKANTVTLRECLFSQGNLLVTDTNNKSFTNEVVIPFTKINVGNNLTGKIKTTASRKIDFLKAERKFEPGSRWLYFKIYTGNRIADRIIKKEVYDFCRKSIRRKTIDKWFFLRYNDPEFHIRLRLSIINEEDSLPLLAEFRKVLKSYLKNTLVNSIQIDTYKREIERYGGSTIELSETFFYINSVFVCKLLNLINSDEDEDLKLVVGIMGVDLILGCAKFNNKQKYRFYEEGESKFTKEFNILNDNPVGILLKKEFYGKRSIIESVLASPADFTLKDVSKYAAFSKILRQFKKRYSALFNELDTYAYYKQNKNDLLESYVHMFMNRFFNEKQRFFEAKIYFYCSKHYLSVFAKEKHKNAAL